MTKVQVQYDLVRPLSDEDAKGIADVHGVYGIARVYLAQSLDRVTVDFDASRLTANDVQAALIRSGIPIRRQPVFVADT